METSRDCSRLLEPPSDSEIRILDRLEYGDDIVTVDDVEWDRMERLFA